MLIPSLHVLFTIGIILAVIGLVLLLVPSIGLNGGRPLGGRRWY